MYGARYIACAALAGVLLCRAAAAAPRNELSAAAGIDSAFDDNVYNGRGPDFVNRIAPRLSYRLIDPRVKLSTSYELGYWTYALGKAENSVNHRALFSVEFLPTRRLTIKLDDEFARAEDPGFLSRIGVVAPRIGIFDNVADVLIGYALAHRWYGSLGYTYHWTRFDAFSPAQAIDQPPLFDGSEHDAMVALAYRVTRSDDLRMNGRFQLFTAGPQATDANRWNVGTSYAPTVGWRHQFLRQLEATVDAGPLFYQELHDAALNIPNAPGSGITYRLAALLRWYTPTWRASVSYSHDLIGATGIGSAIWADYLYTQVGYHYLDILDAHIGGGYFRNGVAVNQPLSYDGFTADVLVDWSVARNFRLGAYYTLRWQEIGPGAIPAGADRAQFPNVLRNIVGVRLLAVVGADARPPRREVKE